MLGQLIPKLTKRTKHRGRLLTHDSMREDHFRREHEELCRQLRHQQYFYDYRTKCD